MERRRVVFASVALLLVLLVVGVVRGPGVQVARADAACGDAPNWWDALAWISYENCEIQNGGTGSSVTGIFSPVLDDISSGISGLSGPLGDIKSAVDGVAGPIVSAIGGVAGAVVGPVVAWFTPSSADFQPVKDAMTNLSTHAPFSIFASVTADISDMQAALLAQAAAPGIASPAHSAVVTSARHAASFRPNATSGASDFGVFADGVGMWLWFLDQIGMSQSTISLLFDAFIVLTMAWSIAADLGVRTGKIEAGAVPGPGEYVGSSLSRLDSYRKSYSGGRAGSSPRSRDAAFLRRKGL